MSSPPTNIFISYNKADRKWAEWIAWQLEANGYTTTVQAWDFRPGANFVQKMQQATSEADKTIAVLSPDYLDAKFPQSEWQAAFATDPTGDKRSFVPVRVRECSPEGLLPQIIHINLVGLSEIDAKIELMNGIRDGRGKPPKPPKFPGTKQPQFPGTRRSNRPTVPEAEKEINQKNGGGVATAVDTEAIEIRINRDFDTFSPKQQRDFLAGIREFLKIENEIRVIRKRRGSVVLTLGLTPQDAERLYWAVKSGQLSDWDVDSEFFRRVKQLRAGGKVKAPSKSEILDNIAAATNLSRKEVSTVLEALRADISKSLGKKGAGVYQIPGLCKIVRKSNPPKPAREGTDPRTGEKVMFKGKPASTTVKVRALKNLKDMVK